MKSFILFFVILFSCELFSQVNYKDTVYVRADFSKPIDTTSVHINQWVLVNLDSMKQVPLYAWTTRWTQLDGNGNIVSIGNPDLHKVDTLMIVAGRHYASTFYRIYMYGIVDTLGIAMIEDSVHNSAIYFTDSNLPVELVSFTGKQKNNKITLYWTTATEVNNYGFDIERKFVYNKDWEKIGFVDGNGNSNSPKDYTFVDEFSSGTDVEIFYRLKQIDTDGSIEYSNSILIHFIATVKDYSLSLYPNPFNPTTTVDVNIPVKSDIELTVYTVLGEKVYYDLINDIEGNYKIFVNMNSVSSGIYLFVVKAGNNVLIKQGMLLK